MNSNRIDVTAFPGTTMKITRRMDGATPRRWPAAIVLLLLFGILSMESAAAQSVGTMTGRVVDDAGEPIPGATVILLNTSRGAATNVEGRFTIEGIPVGPHVISISALDYRSDTIAVTVEEAGTGLGTIVLAATDESIMGEAVVKTGRRSVKSEEGALNARRDAVQMTEVMSAEEIGASGASDAGDALQRQTGMTIVGGQHAIVRGLKPRYSSAQLNGVAMMSPEPETKSVPFDLFPAGMIDNITTVKTFTPDNPGDFAGGLVKIDTKNFPRYLIVNAGVGTGMNSETTGVDGLGYAGGGTDWLGVDDGARALPDAAREIRALPDNAAEADLLSAFGDRPLRPTTTTLPLNSSFNLTLGNSVGSDENPIGILFAASYSAQQSHRVGMERYAENTVNGEGQRNYFYDYLTSRSTTSVLWGSLFNLSVGLGEKSMIGFKGMMNRSADDEALLVTGAYNASTTGQVRRTQLRYVERTIGTGQIVGEHAIGFPTEGSRLEWRLSHSIADRLEPDNRQTAYLRADASDDYAYNGNFGSGNGRFFSDLDDAESSAGFDWTVPFGEADETSSSTRLKVGTLARLRSRAFTARRFIFGLSSDANADDARLDPELLFTPEAVARGAIDFEDRTTATDAYNADEAIGAAYAMVEAPIGTRLRLIGGARAELWDLELTPFNQFIGRPQTDLAVSRSVVDILPSLTAIYSLGERMSLRAAASQTLARPEFRELAPFRFDDYKVSTFGNPTLERTRILNGDLRWEWYPRAGELLAVSAFAKHFTNPIETFFLLGGSDLQVEPVNADGAQTWGAELEVRKGLDDIASFLSNVAIGGNVTVTTSRVSFAPGQTVSVFTGNGITQKPVEALTSLERPMQGQSPYVVNLMAGYDNPDWGTELTILYNMFGERLATIGTEGFPDVYEQPQSMLDLTVRQKLPGGLSLSLKGKNLLGADVLYTQEFTGATTETVEVERYSPGRSLSIGLSFSLDEMRSRRSTTD